MNVSAFDEIFARFRENFPPASGYTEGVTLKLTTSEVETLFSDFCPGMKIPDLYSFMVAQGYAYRAIEYNESVIFYWLFDNKKE